MNRLVTLAVASGVAFAAPHEQCTVIDTSLDTGVDIRGESDAEYFLVAMLKAW